jgi:predicted dehydrogenase
MSVDMIRKTIAKDFINIDLQDAQYIDGKTMRSWDSSSVLKNPCWTMEEDGIIYFIGGVHPVHPYRYIMWAFLSKFAGNKLLRITKEVMRNIMTYSNVRLETVVSTDFDNGHKWVKMLGFEYEGTMKSYTQDGKDMAMYALILT